MTRNRLLTLSSLLIFGCAAVCGATGYGADKHRAISWISSQEETTSGVWLYSQSDGGQISRVLIVGPGGAPIILTKTIDARRGSHRMWLTDDASGWWIEYREDFGVTWTGLHQAVRYMIDGGGRAGGRMPPVQLTLRTSAGFEASVTAALQPGPRLPGLLAEIESGGRRAELAESIPAGLLEVAHLLSEALQSESEPSRKVGGDAATLLELCTWSGQDRGGAAPGAGWRVETLGDLEPGLIIADPDLLEVVARFPSLENVDPMRGLRPSDLFPD